MLALQNPSAPGLVYPSREPLEPLEYALYRVEGAPSRGVLYRAAGLVASP